MKVKVKVIVFETERIRLVHDQDYSPTTYRLYRAYTDDFGTKHWSQECCPNVEIKGEWYERVIAMLMELILQMRNPECWDLTRQGAP